jgi:hypothetical protein
MENRNSGKALDHTSRLIVRGFSHRIPDSSNKYHEMQISLHSRLNLVQIM